MRKILLTTLMASMFSLNASALTMEEAQSIKQVQTLISEENSNIQKIYLKNPEFFNTNDRVKSDVEMEDMLIEKFGEMYFSQKEIFDETEYTNLMNGFFVDALKSGHRNLADKILFESGANIDLNYMSSNPINNPLMAVATSFAYDGGDIEYFMKLVQMGADFTYTTEQNNVPLMSLASAVNNYKIVLYLAMKGESPMHLDGFDYYPMDYAVRNDASQTILTLSSIIKEYKNQIEAKNAARKANQ